MCKLTVYLKAQIGETGAMDTKERSLASPKLSINLFIVNNMIIQDDFLRIFCLSKLLLAVLLFMLIASSG